MNFDRLTPPCYNSQKGFRTSWRFRPEKSIYFLYIVVGKKKMAQEMDRSAWLKEQRRLAEEQEDTLYAPIYDEKWGAIDPMHQQFFTRFLERCPPQGLILDAVCGTGKYWPLILASSRTVFGIDQSQGMLARGQEKFPEVAIAKVGLQEMRYREAFDGAVCIDAMEMVFPEDWPLVLGNLYRALKPNGYFYFTVEIAAEQDIEDAFAAGQQLGLPIVYGEWAYAGGYHGEWAQDGGYHYYPKIEQVKEWVHLTRFRLIDETAGGEYHHFLVQKH
jgi:SAM-dependent methyltransferase